MLKSRILRKIKKSNNYPLDAQRHPALVNEAGFGGKRPFYAATTNEL